MVGNTTYDYEKAATVEQGIPTRLVVGVVMPEGITHAWNQAYIGGQWVWMDATFDDLNHVETDYIQERVY